MSNVSDLASLKQQILELTRLYSRQAHSAFRPAGDPLRADWKDGSVIPYAGRVFTEDEVEAAVSSTLDFWLTLGSEGDSFQKELAAFLGVRSGGILSQVEGLFLGAVALRILHWTSYDLDVDPPENAL